MPGKDISAKARTSSLRRSVRSQLIAAPLDLAQTGLHNLHSLLNHGNCRVLDSIRLGERYSIAETLKLLAQAPPLSVLKLMNKVNANGICSLAAKVAAELDFVQESVDLVATKDSLNPSMNAIAEAFRRRHFSGRFVAVNHNVKLDSLVYADTSSANDFDHCASDIQKLAKEKVKPSQGGAQKMACFYFQRGICRWRKCRFEHRCSGCGRLGHGRVNCWQRGSPIRTSRQERDSNPRREQRGDSPQEVPPHPRRRTDRSERT